MKEDRRKLAGEILMISGLLLTVAWLLPLHVDALGEDYLTFASSSLRRFPALSFFAALAFVLATALGVHASAVGLLVLVSDRRSFGYARAAFGAIGGSAQCGVYAASCALNAAVMIEAGRLFLPITAAAVLSLSAAVTSAVFSVFIKKEGI